MDSITIYHIREEDMAYSTWQVHINCLYLVFWLIVMAYLNIEEFYFDLSLNIQPRCYRTLQELCLWFPVNAYEDNKALVNWQ